MRVSIIIPVYNVEPYIERCIESVLCQTYRELEVILVDDSSPDCSMDLARKCIDKSNRNKLDIIYLRHDHNLGISAARNTGIEAATGDYLFFLDSDDWITDNCISLLVQPLNNRIYDFVTAKCETFGSGRSIPRQNMNGEVIGTGKIAKTFNLNSWHCMVWNKLINVSFIRKHNLLFKEGLVHEDLLWSAQLACLADSMFFVNETTYFYRVHDKSFSSTETLAERQKYYKEVLRAFYEYLEKKKVFRQEVEGVIEERLRGMIRDVLTPYSSHYQIYKTIRKCDVRTIKAKNMSNDTMKKKIKYFDLYIPIPLGFIYKKNISYLQRISRKTVTIRKNINHFRLLDFTRGKNYYRRKSQYTRTGKIALCCIAKSENDYLRFFVEYYKNLHFDTIFIYDNNDPDGECFEDVIGDYIKEGFVKVTDYRGVEMAQMRAYQDCYDKHNKEFNWIAFFDVDEFLTFSDETQEIHSFLDQNKFLPFQVFHVNWKIYGDNDLLDNDGRNVIERFKSPVMPLDFCTREFPWNNHVKSIVRGGLSSIIWKSPHTPTSDYYACCNSEGIPVEINSPFQSIEYRSVFLRHYRTKTIGEWVKNKMRRGFPDRSEEEWKKILSIDHFFEYNTRTEEKERYAEELL